MNIAFSSGSVHTMDLCSTAATSTISEAQSSLDCRSIVVEIVSNFRSESKYMIFNEIELDACALVGAYANISLDVTYQHITETALTANDFIFLCPILIG